MKAASELDERLSIVSRSLAASVGGFAFASGVATLLAAAAIRSGLVTPAGAVSAASVSSFAIWCVAVLWAFHARSVPRIWINLLATGFAAGALAKLILGSGS